MDDDDDNVFDVHIHHSHSLLPIFAIQLQPDRRSHPQHQHYQRVVRCSPQAHQLVQQQPLRDHRLAVLRPSSSLRLGTMQEKFPGEGKEEQWVNKTYPNMFNASVVQDEFDVNFFFTNALWSFLHFLSSNITWTWVCKRVKKLRVAALESKLRLFLELSRFSSFYTHTPSSVAVSGAQ